MYEYNIFLPNERAKTIWLVTVLILLINCFVFGFMSISTTDNFIRAIAITAAIIGCVSVTLVLLKFNHYLSLIAFILLAAGWLVMDKYLVASLLICFAIIGKFAREKLKVAFGRIDILYPSFPPKKIKWSTVTNVVLKDDVLTIDLKNNKLVQVVINRTETVINETAFNEFCKNQIQNSTP